MTKHDPRAAKEQRTRLMEATKATLAEPGPPAPSELTVAVNHLRNAVEDTTNELERLVKQLTPLLRAEPQFSVSPPKEAAAPVCQLTHELEVLTATLNQNAIRIQELRNQLAV